MSLDMEASAISVFWYAVGVWQTFSRLSEAEQKEAGLSASDALACEVANVPGNFFNIKHFGPVSGNKAIAVMSCYIVGHLRSEHADSPFLAAARDAKVFSETVMEPPK